MKIKSDHWNFTLNPSLISPLWQYFCHFCAIEMEILKGLEQRCSHICQSMVSDQRSAAELDWKQRNDTENLRRILTEGWRWERWIAWILHQSPSATSAAALIDEVFKSSISHHLLFLPPPPPTHAIMEAEELCCVCRSDEPWPEGNFAGKARGDAVGVINK